jgi:hypothetical protein
MIVIMIEVAVVVPVAIPVAVTVAIPMMVVLAAAPLAVPVAFKESLSVMMGCHPTRCRIGRTAPISVVPPISVSNRIPVAIHPKIIRAGTCGNGSYDPRRWRRSNSHPDRDLSEYRSEREQGQGQ